MFNLERAIAKWRQRMAVSGIKDTAVLDELESHLWEDIDRQVKAGLNEEKAARAAMQRMGRSDLLRAEFAKVGGAKAARAGKVLGIACGLAALPLSVLAVPTFLTVPELSGGQRFIASTAVLLTFLSIASWRFSHRFLPAIGNRKIRLTTSVACGITGLISLYIFGALLPTVIVPRFFSASNTGELRPVFAMGITMLWVMAVTAVLGAIAYGLEGAARRQFQKSAYV
jgi:hypothetical protein